MSQGSLQLAVKASGQVRRTAVWIDSVPGVAESMAFGHVAFEFVMICLPCARSYQALFRMPWWPG